MSNRQISSKRKSSIRIGSETSATRAKILDEVERLMISEGYASVTSRRVAKELDIKPSLVHYYFPTTDDLLLAVWLRSIETQRFHEEAEAINPLTLTKLRNRKTNCLSTGSIPISAITIK